MVRRPSMLPPDASYISYPPLHMRRGETKPSMLRRRTPKGQHRRQKRTTNHHARQKACPQTQTTTIYPPYSSIGSDHRETHDEKKTTTKAQKVWGGHGQWGNNEKANKYVKNTKEGAKGAHHARIPKRTQSRKVKENGDKVKEKHGMKPHPRPTHTTFTRSRYRRCPRTTGKQLYGEQVC